MTSDAEAEQRTWVIVTIASVLLAIAMLWLANKWITRPLRSLAEQAATMAGERLPAAVQEILAARRSEDVVHPDVEPVRVRAGGEVREVAAALNQVQDSAIGLAVEQARLRGNVADAFVNLGRRNQNLLSRQLEFITQLENDESDPETLEHLFKLDHLATRMRRNAESLLVLAGHEPPRTWSGPVEIGDVVRGALGEVEGYQRVRLRHLDDARVDGAAAVDISHVIAELVENALSFSPPDADVEVYGRRDEFGYLLTIVDQGIGIPADELERANALISSPDTGTFAASRFLGHYVVAQLAARHGLGVLLTASPLGGITAMIALPAVLLGRQAPPLEPAPAVLVVDEPEPERPELALPRREAPPDLPVRAPSGFSEHLRPDVATDAPLDDVLSAYAAAPPEPEPEQEPEPQPPTQTPEPTVLPARPQPRVGLGTFADLRATPPSPARAPQPPASVPPAPEPVAPERDASDIVAAATPDRVPAGTPDRAAAFAEVASAVDTVAGIGANAPEPANLSEDLLPHRLPKRGRRSSRLSAPWSREKPARPAVQPRPAPAPSVPDEAPAPPTAPGNADAHGRVVESPAGHAAPTAGGLRFPPGGPAFPAPPAGAAVVEENGAAALPEPAAAHTDGENRFAFFAAFRAAAEQAREEAGIDNRRMGQ